MNQFTYVAFDTHGKETRGRVEGVNQTEALDRIKAMGFFPTKLVSLNGAGEAIAPKRSSRLLRLFEKVANVELPGMGNSVGQKTLALTTRQLATLIEAGLPLVRGLRLLHEQETHRGMRKLLMQIAQSIEGGSTFSEALANYPKVFNRLYVNMVRAGELGGMLDEVLKRLAEFMEKAQKIKGKVIAGLFYPTAVMVVAAGVLVVLMVYIVPKFKEIFEGLTDGRALPSFTLLVLRISEVMRQNVGMMFLAVGGLVLAFKAWNATQVGRRITDRMKLRIPVFGPVIRKVAVSRFSRTFGTLVSNGVPILQALTIVKETSGNVIVAGAVAAVHESVKEGETITAPLKAARVFPAMVVGMVDVGEQTGALPEMLLKIADTYDDEVDNAVAGMTSLLEPIMLVLLAIVVGGIVIAMFLPIIDLLNGGMEKQGEI